MNSLKKVVILRHNAGICRTKMLGGLGGHVFVSRVPRADRLLGKPIKFTALAAKVDQQNLHSFIHGMKDTGIPVASPTRLREPLTQSSPCIWSILTCLS